MMVSGSAIGQMGVLVWKDVLIDLRRKENLLGMFLFALLTLLIFNFAMGAGEGRRYRITPLVMSRLLAEGRPPPQVRALAPLRGRTFNSRAALLEALASLEGGKVPGPVRIAVLKHAGRGLLRESAPGLFWITVLLAGVLGLSKSFAQEREEGCMDGLLLTPVSRGVLYLGKMLSNTIFLGLIQVLFLPLFALFFDVELRGVWLPLAVVMAGGTLGFTSLGTLLGGITASLKGREILLPILLFPLLVPIVVVAVYLTGAVLDGANLWEQGAWLRLMGAFDVIFLIVSYLAFEYVMEN